VAVGRREKGEVGGQRWTGGRMAAAGARETAAAAAAAQDGTTTCCAGCEDAKMHRRQRTRSEETRGDRRETPTHIVVADCSAYPQNSRLQRTTGAEDQMVVVVAGRLGYRTTEASFRSVPFFPFI
jgi:hypothetical protein